MDSPLAAVSAGPPDLLRRFVATPFRETFLLGSLRVLAQTNDPALLHLLRESAGASTAAKSSSNGLRAFRWKLIREDDVRPAPSEPMVLRSGPLTVVTMGPACLAGFDYEKNEALSFLGFAGNEDGLRQTLALLTTELVKAVEPGIPGGSLQSEPISNRGTYA